MFGLAIGGASFLNILLPYAFHARSDSLVGQSKHFLTCQCPPFPIIPQVAIVQIAQGLVQVSCSLQSTINQSPSLPSGTCLSGHARFQMISAINNPKWLVALLQAFGATGPRHWNAPNWPQLRSRGKCMGLPNNACCPLPLQFLRRCRVRLATERMAGLLRALVNALLHLWCKTNFGT